MEGYRDVCEVQHVPSKEEVIAKGGPVSLMERDDRSCLMTTSQIKVLLVVCIVNDTQGMIPLISHGGTEYVVHSSYMAIRVGLDRFCARSRSS